jgi:lipoteichoic acid synthase
MGRRMSPVAARLLAPWNLVVLAVLASRLFSLAALYVLERPDGGRVVEIPLKFVRVAALSEVATVLLLAVLWRVAAHRLWHGGERTRLAIDLTGAAAAGSYLLASEIDAQLRRWMGLRLNLVFVRRFADSADEAGFWTMLARYAEQDAAGFACLAVLGMAVPGAAFVLAWRRRPAAPPRGALTRGLLVAGVAFMGLSIYYESAMRKWRLAGPFVWGFVFDLARDARDTRAGEASEDGRAALRELTEIVPRDPRYPLWRHEAEEAASLAAFRSRPLAERPDVVLVAVESLRGWVLDWRDPRAAERAPHLHALWRERGVGFSRAHSNGYPSGEGNMNLHLGLWSHPFRAVLAEHVSIRTRSLPDVLGDAGYWRVWLTGSDPSFDNLQHWVRRWYDRWEFHDRHDDFLVERLIAAYDAAPPDRPRLLSLYTVTTHPPYDVPPSEGPPLDDPDAAYARALRFADRALGRLMEHVRRRGQWDRTLWVVTGDHAQPNARHREHEHVTGVPHAGNTWTSLLVAGPGIGPASVVERTVSHVDVPPTVLARLGLRVSNHFLGRDVLAPALPERPALATLYGGLALMSGGELLVGAVEGDDLRRLRYDPGPGIDPALYGAPHERPVQEADRTAIVRAREAVRAYTRVLGHDRLRPPPP